jgi:carbonic anhydrase/acetyltransferase-like protein (isoleucine patch superfamily)
MLIEHRGSRPTIDPSAYVAPTAVLSGDVTIGAGCRILHHAIITAENGRVVLGADVVVMEHALIRGRRDHPVLIGDAVLIGPHAHVNGATIEDEVFIATGVSMFPGSVAGSASELRVDSVLHVNSRLKRGGLLPIGWIGVGDPAQVFAPDRHEEIWEVQRELDFTGTVYGVERGTSMRELMARQSEFFGVHRDDRTIE